MKLLRNRNFSGWVWEYKKITNNTNNKNEKNLNF